MRRAIERVSIGVFIPITFAALILSVGMLIEAQSLSAAPETVGTLLGFGFIIMGAPALIASIIAEKLNRRIINNSNFYYIAVIAGAICCLMFTFIAGGLYASIVWVVFGAVMGGITSILLRLHYNKYSANKALKSDAERAGAV